MHESSHLGFTLRAFPTHCSRCGWILNSHSLVCSLRFRFTKDPAAIGRRKILYAGHQVAVWIFNFSKLHSISHLSTHFISPFQLFWILPSFDFMLTLLLTRLCHWQMLSLDFIFLLQGSYCLNSLRTDHWPVPYYKWPLLGMNSQMFPLTWTISS